MPNNYSTSLNKSCVMCCLGFEMSLNEVKYPTIKITIVRFYGAFDYGASFRKGYIILKIQK